MRFLIDFGLAQVMTATCPRGHQVVWFRDGTAVLVKDGRPVTSSLRLIDAYSHRAAQ